MYYDILDDKGKLLQLLKIDIFYEKPKTEYHEKVLYSPVGANTKFITVKPYTYILVKKDKLLTDAKGQWVKSYQKALEMKIPLKG